MAYTKISDLTAITGGPLDMASYLLTVIDLSGARK